MTQIPSHEFDSVLKLICDGKLVPPGLCQIEDHKEALWAIYHNCLKIIIPPQVNLGGGDRVAWPLIGIRTSGMASRFNGRGVILTAAPGTSPRVFTFEFCHHEFETSGSNPARGWVKAVCRKCGFDASIDSGD